MQETSVEFEELCAAAYERWLRMCKRNPNRCIFGPRPRNKAKTAMQSTYDEPDDLFDPPEKVGDGSADATETRAADDVAEDTDEPEQGEEAEAFNRLMRFAAVGPFKLAQSKRRVWEVAPKPTDAEFAAGLHVPEFKAGRDWRVAQRFEDKWHEGVLNPMRYGTLRTVVSSVRSALRGWSHLIAPNDCCRLWLGMADNWVIRKYANVMQCRGWEFHELHRDAAVMQVTARVRLHWAIPRKLRPGPGERRRGREARVKRRRRRGSPAPFLVRFPGL